MAQPINWINQVKNKPFVDVRSYGAKGNGTTDDTAAIQEAIDDNPGGLITFPSGVFMINDDGLHVTVNGTVLKGGADRSTTLTAIEGSNPSKMIYIDEADYCQIRGLSIVMNNDDSFSQNPTGGDCIYIYKSQRGHLDDLWIQGAGRHNIYGASLPKNVGTGNESCCWKFTESTMIYAGSSGMYGYSLTDWRILGVEFQMADLHQFHSVGCGSIRFTGCDFGGAGSNPIPATGGHGFFSEVTDWSAQVGGGKFMFSNCQFGNNMKHDLYINGINQAFTDTAQYHNLISACTFIPPPATKLAGYSAIVLKDSPYNSITGCVLAGNTASGSGVGKYSYGIKIEETQSGLSGYNAMTGNAMGILWGTSAISIPGLDYPISSAGGTDIIGTTGVPGKLSEPLGLLPVAFASLPSAADAARIMYVTGAKGNASTRILESSPGQVCIAVSDGTNWKSWS